MFWLFASTLGIIFFRIVFLQLVLIIDSHRNIKIVDLCITGLIGGHLKNVFIFLTENVI